MELVDPRVEAGFVFDFGFQDQLLEQGALAEPLDVLPLLVVGPDVGGTARHEHVGDLVRADPYGDHQWGGTVLVRQAVVGPGVQQFLRHVGQVHEGCEVQWCALVVATNVHVGAVGNRHRDRVRLAQQDR